MGFDVAVSLQYRQLSIDLIICEDVHAICAPSGPHLERTSPINKIDINLWCLCCICHSMGATDSICVLQEQPSWLHKQELGQIVAIDANMWWHEPTHSVVHGWHQCFQPSTWLGEIGCHARTNPESRVVFDRDANRPIAARCVSHNKIWCKVVGPPYQPQVVVPIVLWLEIESKDPGELQRFQKPFEIPGQMLREGHATSDIAHIENHGNERLNDSPLNYPN